MCFSMISRKLHMQIYSSLMTVLARNQLRAAQHSRCKPHLFSIHSENDAHRCAEIIFCPGKNIKIENKGQVSGSRTQIGDRREWWTWIASPASVVSLSVAERSNAAILQLTGSSVIKHEQLFLTRAHTHMRACTYVYTHTRTHTHV